jgi:hypothetical protein
MRKKSGSYLILGLAINTIIFSGSAQAFDARWGRFKLSLDGVTCGVDRGDLVNGIGKNKRILCPLGTGFATPKAYSPVLKYNFASQFTFDLEGEKVKSGAIHKFKPIKYGSTQPISLYSAAGKLIETYTLVFTNLPVIEISFGTLVNGAKVPGTIQLMSGEFPAQNTTAPLNMSIDVHGQTSAVYPKKSYNVKTSKNIQYLDLRNNNDWILSAEYQDPTFSRNIVSHGIFTDMYKSRSKNPAVIPKAGKATIQGRYAEVIANKAYAGIYLLEEKVDRTLLDLNLKTSVQYKADYSVDKNAPGGSVFFTSTGLKLNFSQQYPKVVNYTPLQKLVDFVATSTNQAFVSGIKSRVDLASFADWYLLVMATQAKDNINKNFFLANDNTTTGKFFIVPWDHNASFGMGWDGAATPAEPTVFAVTTNNLIKRLIENPQIGFNTMLIDRWTALRDTVFAKDKILARFNKNIKQLDAGGAKIRNNTLWPATHLPKTTQIPNPPLVPNPKIGTIAYISTFLDKRLNDMDRYIDNLPE